MKQRVALTLAALASVVFVPAAPGLQALPALVQVSFDQAVKELSSPDAGVRLKSAQLLKEAAYPEAAVPLAALIGDPQDAVQLEAIAAELNIFLAEKIVPKTRKALVIEVRNAVLAEPAFSSGPLALSARPVPLEVLTALLAAIRDDNPRVGVEALYAFGTLGVQPAGASRLTILRASGPSLAALVGSPDPGTRYAAVRVLGRVFAKRANDEPVDSSVGDAVITALNDNDKAVKAVAMEALGAMRYDRGVQALTQLFEYYAKGPNAEAALDALARIGSPTSASLFESQLTSKTSAFKGIAIEGLARLGNPAKLADIQTALTGERSESTQLAGSFAACMLANASLDPIAEALTRTRQHDQAKRYLIEIAPGRTALFTRVLQDPDVRMRRDAVDAIGLGGDPAALPLVEPLVGDKDPDVARAAEHAAARLRKTGG
jgi:HEAT repeat protein